MPPVFLEVALNGPWVGHRQPLAPLTVEELIDQGCACAKLGASVIHVHVYDPITGQQIEDPDSYARVITGIRSHHDVIVYPTLPLSGASGTLEMTPETRFACVETLAQAGLLEWAVIDPGSTTIVGLDELAASGEGFLYRNTVAELRHGLSLAAQYGFHPSFAIYEPGFARIGAALAKAAGSPAPIWRFMFSDAFAFGFPPRDYGLQAYLGLLEELAPGGLWMAAGLRVELEPILDDVLRQGGHVRVGLEDAPFDSPIGNVAFTMQAAHRITSSGYRLGSAEELRLAVRADGGLTFAG